MDKVATQAMMIELEAQRSAMGTRAAQLAAELAVANQRIQTLVEQVENQAKESEALKK